MGSEEGGRARARLPLCGITDGSLALPSPRTRLPFIDVCLVLPDPLVPHHGDECSVMWSYASQPHSANDQLEKQKNLRSACASGHIDPHGALS